MRAAPVGATNTYESEQSSDTPSKVKAQDLKIFMRQAELTLEQKGLWVLILTWANQDGSNAFPTQKTLSEVSGMSLAWVKKHIALLKRLGYLRIGKEKKKGSKHFHNVYILSCRSTHRYPYGYTRVAPTKSLYQNSDSLAVESEAILRVLPDHLKEDGAKYG